MSWLVLSGIRKRFGAVEALRGVDLRVERGTVHAIVGENGAGKSTLAKILYGLVTPDAGSIEIAGRRVTVASPRDAMRHGIGMVPQKFQQVPSLTVTENIILGSEPAKGGLLDLRRARREVRSLIERYDLRLEPDRPVNRLSMGERQRVEIAKILYRQASILIFDEATSVLTPQETSGLFAIIEKFVAEGKTILYITHKFAEVFRLARHVTVLRSGRVVSSRPIAETDVARLTRDVVGEGAEIPVAGGAGRGAPGGRHRGPGRSRQGTAVLHCAGLWVVRDDGVPALRGIELEVYPGEIVGVAGVEGNGQDELAGAIVGTTPIQRGSVYLDGRRVEGLSVRQRRRSGIGWIPPDRYGQGSAPLSSVGDNLLAGELDRPDFIGWGVLHRRAIEGHVRERMRAFDVRAAGPEVPAGALSGGNLQKAIIAREIREGLRLLVASNPTNGLDIRASAFVRDQLVRLRDRGVGVLLISTDLDEVLELSDRVVVLYRGRVAARFLREDADRDRIGRAMTGASVPSGAGGVAGVTGEVDAHG